MNISKETLKYIQTAIFLAGERWDKRDFNAEAEAAIQAFIVSKEMQQLIERSNKVAVYLNQLFPINSWAGIASDQLSKALIPFTSEQQS